MRLARRRRRLLRRLSAEQNHRCGYCGRRFGEGGPLSDASLEHLQKVSDGGQDSWWNCIAACVRCNSRRDMSPMLWFAYVVQALQKDPLPRKMRVR